MPSKTKDSSATSDRELVASRVLDAPREVVFGLWTDPAHITNWWGPVGFTTTTNEMDLRPGGIWRFVMHGPDGTDYQNRIVYDEIVRPERLVYRHAGEGDFEQVRFHVTVTFAEQGEKTELTMRMVFESAEELKFVKDKHGAEQGLHDTLARLAELAPIASEEQAGSDIVIVRTIDAPRELVFKAWTEPERIMQWWGPKRFTTPHCTVQLHPGGVFHYCMRAPDGKDYWGLGRYDEIIAPERLVYTDSFSDETGSVVPPTAYGLSPEHPVETVVTVTFDDVDGRTRLTVRYAIPMAAPERDGALQGWNEMIDRLRDWAERQ